MTVAGPLAPCPQCRLVFADDAAARRHALLDHTAAEDGVALVEELLRTRPVSPAAQAPGEPLDVGARLGLALVVAWLVALVAVLVLLPS